MVMSRWDPWGELAALQRDVQELFGRSSQGVRRAANLVPPMDAYRSEDGSLTIRLELPGVAPENVEINATRGLLTVSGQRKSESEVSGDSWLRRERAVGGFSRSISLSESIDPSSITASFEHGVLELHVPPAPEERTTRIPISGRDTAQTVDVGTGDVPGSAGSGEQREPQAPAT